MFEAHSPLHRSTPGARVIKKKQEVTARRPETGQTFLDRSLCGGAILSYKKLRKTFVRSSLCGGASMEVHLAATESFPS